MTPDKRELMRTAASTLLAHREAGRGIDPHAEQWAETLLKQNPETATRATQEDRRIALTVMLLSVGLSLGVVAGVAFAAFMAGATV